MKIDLSIDIDKLCDECRKPGASESGLCMDCATRIVQGKPMNSQTGKALTARWQQLKKSKRVVSVFSLLQKEGEG